MSVDVDIPQPFRVNLNTSGALDLDLDNIHVSVDRLPKVELETHSDLDLNADAKIETNNQVALQSDSKIDLGLDNIRLKELPEFKVEFGLRPMRFHLPLNFKWRLCVFGVELFSFETCGEGMFVSENFKKHKSERCE